jgi:hypothetical protein
LRLSVAFASSAVFGWSLTTLVITRPDVIPHLATLMAAVLSLEYWLFRRADRDQPAEAAAPAVTDV